MDTFIVVVAILMILDATFALLNISKVESILHQIFPKLNIKQLAIIEGAVGLIILGLKTYVKIYS